MEDKQNWKWIYGNKAVFFYFLRFKSSLTFIKQLHKYCYYMILNDIIILNSVCLLWEFSPLYSFLIGTKKKMKHLRCFLHVLHAYKNCYSTFFSPASKAVSVFQITPFYTVQIQPVWRRKNFTWPWTWMKYILTYAHRV